MLVSNLDHLNLSVRNFEETVHWYNKIFAFNLVEQGVQDGMPWGVIRCNDAMLCIYEAQDLFLPSKLEMKKKGLHYLAHFGLRITDKESWENIITRENLPLLYDGVIQWPHSLAWYINDPTDWEIEVVYWENDTISF